VKKTTTITGIGRPPSVPAGGRHGRHLYTISGRADRFRLRRGTFPVAETISDRILSLPLSSGMTDKAVDRVVEVLDELLG
jgi:dTDP-4-amino-4,6-dideoxygalactose transaminase